MKIYARCLTNERPRYHRGCTGMELGGSVTWEYLQIQTGVVRILRAVATVVTMAAILIAMKLIGG